MANASMETVPKSLRNLRACLLCSLIKTIDQFEYDGCDNCDEYLHMRGNRDMVYDCTSSSFDGKLQTRMLRNIRDWTVANKHCPRPQGDFGCCIQVKRYKSEVHRLRARNET